MPKIEKQFLAREMQWLLLNVLWLKGESTDDLVSILEKMKVVMKKIEEDLYYHEAPYHKKKMNYEFRFIK